MSKGNPKVVVRLEKALIEKVREAVERRNAGHVTTEHWDVSAYVRKAIDDKLKHDARSRRKSRKKPYDSEVPWCDNCQKPQRDCVCFEFMERQLMEKHQLPCFNDVVEQFDISLDENTP